MKDASYAVYGCGNRDWVATFQKVPTLIDDTLAERGAKRLLERGVGDAGGANFFDSFDQWETKVWEKLEQVRIRVMPNSSFQNTDVFSC